MSACSCHYVTAEEERLESEQAGQWTEDMAQNEKLPGEEDDPDITQRVPLDSQV